MLPKTKGHLSNETCRDFISGKPETEAPETFIHHLRRKGYYTVGIGKISHYVDGLLYGYNDSVRIEYELPHSWDEMLLNPGKWGTGWNAFFGYADGENRQSMKKQVKPYEMADVSDNGYPDGLITEQALEKIKKLAKNEKPFFCRLDFLNRTASLEGPVSDEYAGKLRHAYFACVSYVDAQVGKLIEELQKQGLSENTIVVIWGDHGWHLGDQLVWGKHTIFERALKSAFIVNIPGKTSGKAIEKIVSTVDIYPTLLELCNVDMPHKTDGKSLVPLIENLLAEWEDASYGYFKNGISLRTEKYRLTKYFIDEQPVIELYDHETDPNETKNIATENPGIVESLMPLWEKGNTGLYSN